MQLRSQEVTNSTTLFTFDLPGAAATALPDLSDLSVLPAAAPDAGGGGGVGPFPFYSRAVLAQIGYFRFFAIPFNWVFE